MTSSPSPWALERANALKQGSDNYAWVTTREVAEALDAARKEGIEVAAKLCDTIAIERDEHESPHGAFIRMAILEAAATYELSDEPGWLVSSDGTRISPIPREPITFPALPRLASWKK